MSHWITAGKRAESKGLQRVTTRAVSLLGHLGAVCQLCCQARFFVSQEANHHPTQSALDTFRPTGHLALFPAPADDLKQEERESLQQLRQASPPIETAYQLVEQFLQMVRERTGEQLAAWLAEVEASQLEAFDSFVTGVHQDQDAVLAGLTLPWSNGPLEGHVNRLKLLKRSMYGRANFDLLKLRVFHHPKKSLDRKNKKKQAQQGVPLKTPRVMKNNTNSQHTIIGISKGA